MKIDRKTVQCYVSLTKPGVLLGNVITGVAGFCLASAWLRVFHLGLFVVTIVGMTLIIASACAMNNVLDRDIDRIMARTKKRAVASGAVPPARALAFSITLGLLGAAVLAAWTSWLVVGIGAAGFITYVWLYGALSKRRSIHGTLVGSISGAAPILAGYVAAAGRVDVGAVLAFLALFFWQFPEFYSIAIYRHDEYKAAGVPIMSVVKGVWSTKVQIFIYTFLFVAAALALTLYGYTHYLYAVVMAAAGGYWLWLAFRGLHKQPVATDNAWARRMFKFSLTAVLVYSAMIAVGPLLP